MGVLVRRITRVPLTLAVLSSTAAVLGLFGCRQIFGLANDPALLSDSGGDAGAASDDTGADDAADAASPFTVIGGTPHGETLDAVWGTGAGFVVAVGTSELALVYKNGQPTRYGGTWKGRDYNAVWGFAENDVYAVGKAADGSGFVDHFDGAVWTDVFDADAPLYGVWGTKEGTSGVLAVGARGNVYGWMPGSSWMKLAQLPAAPGDPEGASGPVLWSITGRNLEDFTIVADNRIWHSEVDAGDLAYYDPPPTLGFLFRAAWEGPGSGTSVFLGTNDYGLAWFSGLSSAMNAGSVNIIYRDQVSPGASSSFVNGVWGTTSKVVAVGDQGRILTWDTGFMTVTAVPSPTDQSLSGVWASSLDDVWIVGTSELVLHGSLH